MMIAASVLSKRTYGRRIPCEMNRMRARSIVTNQPIMIFGSCTDVGKTIISAGLCRSALHANYKVCYLKPVQTGELDEYFIKFYANPNGISDILPRTIYHWSTAKSAHIAATANRATPPSDAEILKSVRREMNFFYHGDSTTTNTSTTSSSSTSNSSTNNNVKPRFLVCETAGGVLSPGPNKVLQADVYRPLRLPVLLVGEAKLGGITTTLSSYESLRLRGYTVHAIALIDTPGGEQYGNLELIEHHMNSIYGDVNHAISGDSNSTGFEWNTNKKPTLHRFSALPSSGVLLHDWFNSNTSNFDHLFRTVHSSIENEYKSYMNMREKGKELIWWPFTQHNDVKEDNIHFIESSSGDYYKVIKPVYQPAASASASTSTSNATNSSASIAAESSSSPSLASSTTSSTKNSTNSNNNNNNVSDKPLLMGIEMHDLFDGSASWWTQAVGHGNSAMSLSIAEAAGRYGHVLSPTNLHPNVVQLSNYLIESRYGPGRNWASRVFYTDDGSTGMEVAIKMAMRLGETREKSKKLNQQQEKDVSIEAVQQQPSLPKVVVLAQKDSYHGDTLGTMNTAEPNLYNTNQHQWYKPLNISIPVPYIGYTKGNLCIDVSPLNSTQVTAAVNNDSKNCGNQHQQSGANISAAARTSASVTGAVKGWSSIAELIDMSENGKRVNSTLSTAYETYIKNFIDSHCNNNHNNTNDNNNTHDNTTNTYSTHKPQQQSAPSTKIGALLLEPVMIGAGGIKFIDPLFQRLLVLECRKRDIPIIFDEVAVGMYRLGPSSTADILQLYPDIAVYGKMISGGYLPISATLATQEVFDGFLGSARSDALLHGHSYTANPIACAAALQAIRIMQNSSLFQNNNNNENDNDDVVYDDNNSINSGSSSRTGSEKHINSTENLNRIFNDSSKRNNNNNKSPSSSPIIYPRMSDTFGDDIVRQLSLLPGVKAVMGMGSVLAIELHANNNSSSSNNNKASSHNSDVSNDSGSSGDKSILDGVAASAGIADVVTLLRENHVYARPLGNVLYFMATPLTTTADRDRLVRCINRCITKIYYK